MTIVDYFLKWSSETPDSIFLRQPIGSAWREWTWQEVKNKAAAASAALAAAGLEKGDKVALLSANCDEWIICDLAIMFGGFVSVPLYANVNATSMRGILDDSGAKLIFVGKLNSNDWEQQQAAIPSSVLKVAMDRYAHKDCRPWTEFVKEPSEVHVPHPEDIMTIIYTSGTTGEPKGVVHTYRSVIKAVATASEAVMLNRKGNRFISYLPLSHAAERGLNEAGCIYCGGTISFVDSISTFAGNLRDAKPTHFFGVPRIWEKMRSKILDALPEKRLTFLLSLPVVSTFVKRKIKKQLGLGDALVILSGAAPISPALLHWYQRIGIKIREAYGLSEDFNVLAMNPADDIRVGTVGRLFEGQKVFIDPQTSEICQKCDWLMKGYYNRPEQTRQTIVDGVLHTGDMGKLSEDGFLSITGRVKDIFKTAKGEYISPAPLEKPFLASPMVDQACVLGLNYPQPFILVVGNNQAILTDRSGFIEEMRRVLNAVNEGAMTYQKLKKVIVAGAEWTVANGLLTPTLKIKRNVLASKYEPILHALFESNAEVSWESEMEMAET